MDNLHCALCTHTSIGMLPQILYNLKTPKTCAHTITHMYVCSRTMIHCAPWTVHARVDRSLRVSVEQKNLHKNSLMQMRARVVWVCVYCIPIASAVHHEHDVCVCVCRRIYRLPGCNLSVGWNNNAYFLSTRMQNNPPPLHTHLNIQPKHTHTQNEQHHHNECNFSPKCIRLFSLKKMCGLCCVHPPQSCVHSAIHSKRLLCKWLRTCSRIHTHTHTLIHIHSTRETGEWSYHFEGEGICYIQLTHTHADRKDVCGPQSNPSKMCLWHSWKIQFSDNKSNIPELHIICFETQTKRTHRV